MSVQAIYHAGDIINRIYHAGEILFDAGESEQIIFHVIEDDKLILLGAYSAKSNADGLYLDCEPNTPASEWGYPVLNNGVLTLSQVYKATLNGSVLGVE
jgi:hypothetical protein